MEENFIKSLLNGILYNSSDAIYVKDIDGKFILVNNLFENLFKVESLQIEGKTDFDLFPNEVAVSIIANDNKVILENKTSFDEETIPLENESRWFNTQRFPIHNDQNKLIGIVGILREITDKKLLELKYSQLNKEFEAVIDHLPGLFFYKDTENNFLRVNKYMADAHNLKKEDVKGINCYKLYPKDQAQKYYEDDLEVIKSKKPKLFIEEPWETENGKSWVSTSKIPILDELDNVNGIIGFSFDITERKQFENDLLKLSIVIEQSPASIIITDSKGNIEYVNSAFENVTGYTKKEIIGKNPRILKAGNTREEEYKNLWQTILNGDKWQGEFLNKKKNGEFFWESAIITPVKDNVGKIINFVAIKTEVTEYKKLISEIKESEKRFEDIANSSSDWIWEFDAEGRYTLLSGRVKEIIGYEPSELLGQSYFDFIVPENVEKIKLEFSAIFDSKKPIKDYEIWKIGKNGQKICVLKNGIPILDNSGNLIGYRGTENDITERKISEEAARIYSEELEKKNKELQEFVYIASHDLREPLRKVQSFGERLKGKYGEKLEENGRDYVERMQNASERMQTLIDDLLSYSRISTRGKPFESTNLENIARAVISDLSVSILESKAIITLSNLPTIDADRSQMRQLFQNIIGNALKFSKKGEPPEIKISSEFVVNEKQNEIKTMDQIVMIVIEDKGIGIDMKYSEKIFGVFERLHGRSEYEGTGIGLSIVKKIVERHNGKIELESEPEVGSKFKIYLPITQK